MERGAGWGEGKIEWKKGEEGKHREKEGEKEGNRKTKVKRGK